MKNSENETNKDEKKCSICQNFKELKHFSKDKSTKSGLKYQCKECRHLYNINNVLNDAKWNKKYNQENKNSIRKYDNAYKNERYKTDLNFKLRKLLRGRIYSVLKGKSKFKKTLELLGCSVEQYKQHLEQQFVENMSWLNHGIVWEVDHIKACANFDLSKPEEQIECFHYTNLMPRFKTTEIAQQLGHSNHIGNRNKSNKVI